MIIYPALAIAEKHPGYSMVFNQRRKGEVKLSLMLVFFMMAGLITVFWGSWAKNGNILLPPPFWHGDAETLQRLWWKEIRKTQGAEPSGGRA